MKKTRKEIELQGLNRFYAFMVIVLACLLVLTFMVGFISEKNLKQQLSECQEQVPVWTLKFVCYEEDIKITFEQNYTDYEEYNWALELIGDSDYKLFENCEVLK